MKKQTAVTASAVHIGPVPRIHLMNSGKAKDILAGYLFLLPAFLIFIAFMYIPIINGLLMSFQKFNGKKFSWIGFENFINIFQDLSFWNSVKITVSYAGISVFLSILVSLAAAFAIEPTSEKLQKFFRGAFYLPGVAPGVVMAIVWKWLYDVNFGLLNYLLGILGLPEPMWLCDPATSLLSLILMYLVIGLGPYILILLAGLGAIPSDIYESARIDGANKIREVFFIKIPMLKPTILYLVVVQTINAFQAFVPMYLMTSGGPNGSTTTLGYLIYSTAFTRFEFGKASAQATMLMLIIGIIAVVQFRILTGDEKS